MLRGAGAHRLAHPDFSVRSRTATSITFITPMPPRNKHDAHRAQEVFHPVRQLLKRFRIFRSIPELGRPLRP